ncbi:MAG: hypothetical protein KR126chlam1_00316 [Chlamydiae bacterium]|nr:hypothetical protein [Chlamydiota bacterium]
MYLCMPRHELSGASTAEMPYSAQLLYDLVHWRDSSDGLARKISSEIAFIPVAAIALVEAAVRIPFLLLSTLFAEKPKDWFTGEIRALSTCLSSLYALFINLFVRSLSLRLIHFDINWRVMQKTELLFLACMVGREDLIKVLLNMGANPHERHEADITPAITPYALGYPEVGKLFSLNSYEREYFELKTLSHWLGLSGHLPFPKRDLPLEGTISRWMFDSLRTAFREYCKSKNLQVAAPLQEALDRAYLEHSYGAIAERIQKGKLTFVHTGWKKHGICLAFFGDTLAIANGGNRDGHTTLELFSIDSSLITETIIEEIYAHENYELSEGIRYFYHDLPANLSKQGLREQHPLSEAFKCIAPAKQAGGFCALFSKKAALLFGWAMLLSSSPDRDSLNDAKKAYKEFIDWGALHYLETIRPREKFARFPKLLEKIQARKLILLKG